MNLFKAVKDMSDMMTAAPDLFESANQLAENAKAQQAAAATQVAAAQAAAAPQAGQ